MTDIIVQQQQDNNINSEDHVYNRSGLTITKDNIINFNTTNTTTPITTVTDKTVIFLSETFYIISKKNTIFQVLLTDKGLCLRRGDINQQTSNNNNNNNGSNYKGKEQVIPLKDIFGCRCLRSKRKKNSVKNCACSTLPTKTTIATDDDDLKVVDENSENLDETDVSAYLYIYAYIFKKKRKGNLRERTTITLRFRSYDKYEDNNKEAQKWRLTIKQLIIPSTAIPPPSSDLFVNQLTTSSSVVQQHETNDNAKDLRKILILLNPKSGSGKAREIFQQRVAPIFNECEIQYDLYVTKYANFAREFVRCKDIYSWKYICVVGGDGIYFEVVNGLFERPDWDMAITKTAIAIIPCGSGNGLAKTITHLYNEPYEPKPVLTASLIAIKGQTAKMDLVRVETRSKTMYSFLSVGWGLISDIDIESESLRGIGSQRFTLWSVHRLIRLRTYAGKVAYRKIENIQSDNMNNSEAATPTKDTTNIYQNKSNHSMTNCSECHHHENGSNTVTTGGCEKCDIEFGDVLKFETTGETSTISSGSGGGGGVNSTSYRPRLDSWYSATSRKSTYFSTSDSIYQSISERYSMCEDLSAINDNNKIPIQMNGPASKIPALTTSLSENDWTIETGEFIMVHASYQTHLSSDCFFAPSSKLNDGIIWLVIIRGNTSRQELLKFLLGLSTGTHISSASSENISMIPVSAFRIEPATALTTGNSAHSGGGIMTVDGERVENGPIQGEIFPGIANVIVPKFGT